MNVEEFEGCCTARIFTDLGDSRTSEFGYHKASYQRLRKQVVAGILDADHLGGAGIITAIVTNEQVTGIKVLKDLGFTGTGMASKTSHRDVQIELYYLHCKDWVEPAKPADIVAPEAPVAAPQPFAAARNPAPLPVRRHGLRDARGRFVSRDEVRGRITHPFHPDLFVCDIFESGRVRVYGGHALIVTRLEFEQLQSKRRLLGLFSRLVFQPI